MTRNEAQERIWVLTTMQDKLFEQIVELNHLVVELRNEKAEILSVYPTLKMRREPREN